MLPLCLWLIHTEVIKTQSTETHLMSTCPFMRHFNPLPFNQDIFKSPAINRTQPLKKSWLCIEMGSLMESGRLQECPFLSVILIILWNIIQCSYDYKIDSFILRVRKLMRWYLAKQFQFRGNSPSVIHICHYCKLLYLLL